MWHEWNNRMKIRHQFFILLVIFLPCNCLEFLLCDEWTITNENNSKYNNCCSKQIHSDCFYSYHRLYNYFSGIRIHNETLPSGVYSALNNAKLTDSVLKSFNDVDLRWIAREKWTYFLVFNGSVLF